MTTSWNVDGNVVYMLQLVDYRMGKPIFKNKISFSITTDGQGKLSSEVVAEQEALAKQIAGMLNKHKLNLT